MEELQCEKSEESLAVRRSRLGEIRETPREWALLTSLSKSEPVNREPIAGTRANTRGTSRNAQDASAQSLRKAKRVLSTDQTSWSRG